MTREERSKLKEDLEKLSSLQSELAKFPQSEDDWPEYIGYTGEEVE